MNAHGRKESALPAVKCLKLFVLIGLLVHMGACATRPAADDPAGRAAYAEANDPLEPLNRVTFEVNQAVEIIVIRPTAAVYRGLVPRFARDGLRNGLDNLKTPVILVNDLLQGSGKRAETTLLRFLINTTLGLGGLIDVAADMGLEKHDEDFGQTLAVWGIGDGPYIVLPLFGPSSVRDGIGRAGTLAMDPFFWILRDSDVSYLSYVRRGASGIDTYARNMEEIDELKRTSLDYYAAMRDAYRQDRRDAIRNGAQIERELPEYLFEEPADSSAAPPANEDKADDRGSDADDGP